VRIGDLFKLTKGEKLKLSSKDYTAEESILKKALDITHEKSQ
jgi:hypothetical protein